MRPLKARKNEYTFCNLESIVPKNAGLLITGSHENAPVLFQSASSSIVSSRKLTDRKPSLQEIIADLGFFIQPS